MMNENTAKALVIVVSIVTRLFFGFTPLLVSRQFLTNNATDSLTSRPVRKKIDSTTRIASSNAL